MPSYPGIPQLKVTVASTEYTADTAEGSVTRMENGIDTATLTLANAKCAKYPDPLTAGASIIIAVKEVSEADWTTIFSGRIQTVQLLLAEKMGEIAHLKCAGAAYGLAQTNCGEEYGSQSRVNKTLDTITEMLTDASKGIIPKYANSIMGSATSSGFNFTTTNVATINDVIAYAYFPYKPVYKCIDDLCDIVTALKAGTAGPHWIVTPTADLRLKLVDGTQSGWTKYYGDSQANATLEQGKDFNSTSFQALDIEANYILYYGVLRKPAQDIWCENNSADWYSDTSGVPDDWDSYKVIGDYCIRMAKGVSATINISYPSARNAAWNLQNLGSIDNPPLIAFYARKNDNFNYIKLRLETTAGSDYYEVDISPKLTATNTWYHFAYPVGPYYKSNLKDDEMFTWATTGSPDWANINCVTFLSDHTGSCSYFLDDLHFEGLICRVAKNTTSISNNKLKIKVVTDNMGKDDTLKADTDSGTIAQLAYAELLRCQTMPIVGETVTPIIKDLLPGQWLHIHGETKADGTFTFNKDMRVTKVTHTFDIANGFRSQISLTDDLYNAHPRTAYDDLNRVLSAVRPEYQDRQATTIKAGEIDIKVPKLEKDYA
jgi:hypothetical protein